MSSHIDIFVKEFSVGTHYPPYYPKSYNAAFKPEEENGNRYSFNNSGKLT